MYLPISPSCTEGKRRSTNEAFSTSALVRLPKNYLVVSVVFSVVMPPAAGVVALVFISFVFHHRSFVLARESVLGLFHYFLRLVDGGEMSHDCSATTILSLERQLEFPFKNQRCAGGRWLFCGA
jgi:hypothetical protein